MEKLFEGINRIVYYTKKLFWILFAVAGAIFAILLFRKKESGKTTSDPKVIAAEGKIVEDKQKIDALEQDAEKTKDEVTSITEKYKEKIEELEKKKDELAKPGSAGKSSDDLTNAW